MRKSVEDLLDYYQEINFFYNNCMEYANLVHMLNDIIEDIADYAGGYGCTKSLELEADILKEFRINEVQTDGVH